MRYRTRIAALTVAAAIFASTLVGASSAAPVPYTWTYKLRAGVTVRLYDLPDTRKVWVITDTVDLSKLATIDTYAAGSTLSSVKPTSQIAISHKGIAAISGDFGAFETPPFVQHAYLQDGELWGSGIENTLGAFAMTAANPYNLNTPTAYLGNPSLHMDLLTDTATIPLAHLNAGPPTGEEIVGFTPRGGTAQLPNKSNCKVRLKRTDPPDFRWASGDNGVRVTYEVDKAKICGVYVPVTANSLVLSAVDGSAAETTLETLPFGTKVGFRWQYGWPGILDGIGGRPILVSQGAPAGTDPGGVFFCPASDRKPLCEAQPRSAVAVTEPCVMGLPGCKVMLIVVDGRQPGWSTGITLDDFAAFLIDTLGAYAALNLDGGGSATMYTKLEGPWCENPLPLTVGCLVNRPDVASGADERSVPNAVMILPGPDPKDPVPAP